MQIAQKHGKTPAQIMIRWCLEHRTIVIPKSSNPDRIKENTDVFGWSLTSEDIGALDALSG
jgi:diketogulonate reductase-like aldo/keto reductase